MDIAAVSPELVHTELQRHIKALVLETMAFAHGGDAKHMNAANEQLITFVNANFQPIRGTDA